MNDTFINILLSVTGILVGSVVGYFINKFFFIKSIKKTELTTRLQHSSSTILIDKEIEAELEIKFKGEIIKYLHQFQFVILNSGKNSIKSPIKPLKLKIPDYYNLISIEIKHVHPEGRKIDYVLLSDAIEFNFDLLNSSEYFIINLMLSVSDINKDNAIIEKPEFIFEITSEDLPPILKTENTTFSNYLITSIFDLIRPYGHIILLALYYFLGFISVGSIFLLGLLMKISIDSDIYNLIKFKTFFNNFNLWSLFILLAWIMAIPLLIFSILSLIEVSRKKREIRNKFVSNLIGLPDKILKT